MTGIDHYMLPFRRRAVLNYLVAAKGFEMSERLLMRVLEDDLMGVKSRDDMRALSGWMADSGLIELREPKTSFGDATDRMLILTEQGLDVAQGYSDIPGIERTSRKVAERMRRIVAGEEAV